MNNQQQLKLKVRKMSDKVMNIPRQIRSNANIKLIDTTLNNLEQPIYPKDIISSNLNRQRVYFGDAKMKLSKSLDRLSRKLKTTEGFGRTHGGPAVNPSASRGVGGGVRTRKEGFAPAGGQSRGVPPGGAYVTGGASRPTGPYPTPKPPASKFGQGGSGTYKGPNPTPKPTAVPPPVIKFGQGGRGTYKGPYPSYGGYGRGPYPEYRNRTVVRNYYGNGWGGYYDGWSRGWWPWSYPTIPVEVPVEVPVAETATKTPMENQMMFIMVVLAIMLFLYLILRRK